MRRLVVFGAQGSGKTRLATELGRALGLPPIDLDAFYWKSWRDTQPTRSEITEATLALQREESWIIAGNHRAAREARIAACDAVVFLDLPAWLCVWRLVRRRLGRLGRSRSELAPHEWLTPALLAASWRFEDASQPLRRDVTASGKPVITLRRPGEVSAFLRRCREDRALTLGTGA